MIYKKRKPNILLAPYVDCIWLLSAAGTGKGEPEPVLPDGKSELIVHFGDQFEILNHTNKKYERQELALFAGQISERIDLRSTGHVGMVAARFLPFGAARFCRTTHGELLNQVLSLSDVFGSDAHVLQDRILSAASDDDRMDIVERFLLDRLSFSGCEDPLVQRACHYILSSVGNDTVGDLVDLLGVSERQIERKFFQHVGISPKLLMRITRFQKFMNFKHTPNLAITTLTDAALSCGYYDQAHFIRDFKSFSGVSPTQFLAQSHVISDHFTKPD